MDGAPKTGPSALRIEAASCKAVFAELERQIRAEGLAAAEALGLPTGPELLSTLYDETGEWGGYFNDYPVGDEPTVPAQAREYALAALECLVFHTLEMVSFDDWASSVDLARRILHHCIPIAVASRSRKA